MLLYLKHMQLRVYLKDTVLPPTTSFRSLQNLQMLEEDSVCLYLIGLHEAQPWKSVSVEDIGVMNKKVK